MDPEERERLLRALAAFQGGAQAPASTTARKPTVAEILYGLFTPNDPPPPPPDPRFVPYGPETPPAFRPGYQLPADRLGGGLPPIDFSPSAAQATQQGRPDTRTEVFPGPSFAQPLPPELPSPAGPPQLPPLEGIPAPVSRAPRFPETQPPVISRNQGQFTDRILRALRSAQEESELPGSEGLGLPEDAPSPPAAAPRAGPGGSPSPPQGASTEPSNDPAQRLRAELEEGRVGATYGGAEAQGPRAPYGFDELDPSSTYGGAEAQGPRAPYGFDELDPGSAYEEERSPEVPESERDPNVEHRMDDDAILELLGISGKPEVPTAEPAPKKETKPKERTALEKFNDFGSALFAAGPVSVAGDYMSGRGRPQQLPGFLALQAEERERREGAATEELAAKLGIDVPTGTPAALIMQLIQGAQTDRRAKESRHFTREQSTADRVLKLFESNRDHDYRMKTFAQQVLRDENLKNYYQGTLDNARRNYDLQVERHLYEIGPGLEAEKRQAAIDEYKERAKEFDRRFGDKFSVLQEALNGAVALKEKLFDRRYDESDQRYFRMWTGPVDQAVANFAKPAAWGDMNLVAADMQKLGGLLWQAIDSGKLSDKDIQIAARTVASIWADENTNLDSLNRLIDSLLRSIRSNMAQAENEGFDHSVKTGEIEMGTLYLVDTQGEDGDASRRQSIRATPEEAADLERRFPGRYRLLSGPAGEKMRYKSLLSGETYGHVPGSR